jgi:hypothetical protein
MNVCTATPILTYLSKISLLRPLRFLPQTHARESACPANGEIEICAAAAMNRREVIVTYLRQRYFKRSRQVNLKPASNRSTHSAGEPLTEYSA